MSNRVLAVLLILFIMVLLLPGAVLSQLGKWESIGPEGGRIVSLIQDRANPAHFWAATGGKPSRLYESVDHCATWSPVSSWDDLITGLLVTPVKPGWLFAVSRGGPANMIDTSVAMNLLPGKLYASSDGGKTWTWKSFPPIYTISLALLDPKDGSTIHALGQARVSMGIVYLKSTDAGETWSTTALVQRNGWAASLVVDFRNPAVVYAGVNTSRMTTDSRFLQKSTNGGKDFFAAGPTINQLSGQVTGVILDPSVEGTAYVMSYSRVLRSKDDGATWERISGFSGMPQELWIDPKDSRHLILAADKGLSESTDAGENWTSTETKRAGTGTSALVVEPGAKTVIFAASTAGIFRTGDVGKTWQPSHHGISETQVTALCTAPSAPGTVFAGLMMNAVYKTTAGAAATVRWEQLPVFYTCTSIADIKTDTRKPYRVIALEGGG